MDFIIGKYLLKLGHKFSTVLRVLFVCGKVKSVALFPLLTFYPYSKTQKLLRPLRQMLGLTLVSVKSKVPQVPEKNRRYESFFPCETGSGFTKPDSVPLLSQDHTVAGTPFEPGSSPIRTPWGGFGQQAPFHPDTSTLKVTRTPPTFVKSQGLCSSIFSFQQTRVIDKISRT